MTQRRGVQIRCRGCGKAVWSYDIYDSPIISENDHVMPVHTVHDPDPQECGPVDGGTV